ncbi:MAG: Txe/YoeB family addiction module toxin [Methanomassiliicoccaceae archaeon]|nr:Txe/YoeB family addiction module toxin [Methanomassiliicoccaceae archaeon]
MALVYKVILAKQAQKDLEELDRCGYGDKARELLDLLMTDPFRYPPKYKKLRGEVEGSFSRRINAEHRLVYDVLPSEKDEFRGVVMVHMLRTRYKGIIPSFFF